MDDAKSIQVQKSLETAAELLEYGMQKDDSESIEEAYTELCRSLSEFEIDRTLDVELTEDRKKHIVVVKKLESAALLLEYGRSKEDTDFKKKAEKELRYALGEIKM